MRKIDGNICRKKYFSEEANYFDNFLSGKKLSEFIDNYVDAVFLTDEKQEILCWNKSAVKLFKFNENDKSCSRISELIFPSEISDDVEKIINKFLFNQDLSAFNTIQKSKAIKSCGGTFPVEFILSPLYVDGKFQFAFIIRDVSAQDNAEHVLAHAFHAQYIISTILRMALSETNLEEILQSSLRMTSSMPGLIDDVIGCIYVQGKSTDDLSLIAENGIFNKIERLEYEKATKSSMDLIRKTKRSIVSSNSETHVFSDAALTYFGIPILSGDDLLGIINLYIHSDEEENPERDGFLHLFSDALAQAIKLKRIEEEHKEVISYLEYQKFSMDQHAIVSITDQAGVLTYVNDKFCDSTLYSRENLIGKTHEVVNSGYHSKEFFAGMWDTIKSGEVWRGVIKNCRKDGVEQWVDSTIVPFLDEFGNISQYIAIRTDITEQKKTAEKLERRNEALKKAKEDIEAAQNQLVQSEKLASIGQLAAGVAHEINNPVGYVNSNIGTLEKYVNRLMSLLEKYEGVEEQLSEIVLKEITELKQSIRFKNIKKNIVTIINESMEGVDRVKSIVQDLKDFSRVDEAEWQWADLHQGLDSTLNVAHNEIKYKADVVKEYGEIPEIECVASQLNQVFMNLIVNAAQAMEEHGTITIRTGTRNNGVWIEIADDGSGIPEKYMNKIFDPFYTTKPVGKGTGLGLSLSYGIIQKHQGTIDVDSAEGKGTCFHIWLPIQSDNADHDV